MDKIGILSAGMFGHFLAYPFPGAGSKKSVQIISGPFNSYLDAVKELNKLKDGDNWDDGYREGWEPDSYLIPPDSY